MKRGASAAEREFEKLAAQVSGTGAKMMAPATKGIEQFAAESKAKFRDAKTSFDQLAAAAEADMKRIAKAEKDAAKEGAAATAKAGRERQQFGRRVGYWAVRNFSPVTPTLSMGKRLAGDVARGVGLNTDVSSYVSSFVERQKLATDITNSGYLEGAPGAAGMRQNSSAVQAEATAIAKRNGGSAKENLEGLQKFVGFTGDLETGRAVLDDMSKLAIATHASMDDVAGAAGKISKNLGDVPNKAEKINEVMLALAGMGKTGAAELPEFAAQLSKLAPLASRFGGERSANLKNMGVLLQLSAQGGAGSASQAATSAARFVDVFKKGPAIKAWGKSGITYDMTHDAKDNLRSPRELMLMALQHTEGHGQSQKLASLFKSSNAGQVIEPLRQAFANAGGGQKGLAAAAEVYDTLARSGMSLAERDVELANVQETTANKVQRFQSTLEEVADNTLANLLPALEKLAPQIESAVGAFGGLVTWAASDPMGAVVLALGAAITKAGIEQTIRGGIEAAFTAVLASVALATIGALTLTAGAVYLAYESIGKTDEDSQARQKRHAEGIVSANEAVVSGSPAEIEEELRKAKAAEKEEKERLEGNGRTATENAERGLTLSLPGGKETVATSDANERADMAAQTAAIQALGDKLTEIKDALGKITSKPMYMPVQADNSGRQPISMTRDVYK